MEVRGAVYVGGRVTMGNLRVTIGHLRVTVGHPRVTISHLRATMGHLRLTIGYLKATVQGVQQNCLHLVIALLWASTHANCKS